MPAFDNFLCVFVDNGGIYIDTDVISIKSLDPLRKYKTTMASDTDRVLSNGVILTEPYSPFLCLWRHAYYRYTPRIWGGSSTIAGYKLFQTFPDLIHFEPRASFYNPDWRNRKKLVTEHLNISSNFLIHIFRGGIEKQLPKQLSDIDSMDNTLGDVMRFVHYGKTDLVNTTVE